MGLSGEWLEAVRGPEGWDRSWSRALGAQERLQAPMGARWRLFGSYDGDFTGLSTVAFSQATALVRANEDTPLGLKLMRLANVCHVVAARPGGPPGAEAVTEQTSVFAAPIRLLRIPDPLPRAYVVSGVRRAPDDEALAVMIDPTFDARREVVLAPQKGTTEAPANPDFRATARVLWRKSNALAVEVEAGAPGYLVVVEAFHAGWKAFVDGEETGVLRANALFRAVPVGTGRHQVVFEYRSPAAFRGAMSTLLTGAAVLALAAGRRRRPTPAAVSARETIV